MKVPKLDADAERGIFLACVVLIIYYAIFVPGGDFGVIQGNPLAYGVLWYVFNPMHNDHFIWGMTTISIYFTMFAFQRWLVAKGRLSKGVLYTNMISVALFEMLAVQRDVTILMFAPLVTMNPVFIVPMILEKFGLGWSWNLNDPHWQVTREQTAWGKIGIPGQPGFFEWQYLLLFLWFVIPPMYWLGKWFVRNYIMQIDWNAVWKDLRKLIKGE